MSERTNRLQVLLSKEEREKLDRVANEQGMASSVYARAEIIKAVKRDDGRRGSRPLDAG